MDVVRTLLKRHDIGVNDRSQDVSFSVANKEVTECNTLSVDANAAVNFTIIHTR